MSFELITAARELKERVGGPLAVAIIDADAGAHAAALGSDGVDEVLAVSSPVGQFEAHVAQRALEGLLESERPRAGVGGALDRRPRVRARGGGRGRAWVSRVM